METFTVSRKAIYKYLNEKGISISALARKVGMSRTGFYKNLTCGGHFCEKVLWKLNELGCFKFADKEEIKEMEALSQKYKGRKDGKK